MEVLIIVLVIVVVLLLIGAAMSVRVVKQYERGVLFRLGKVLGARAGAADHRPVRRRAAPGVTADRHDADPVPGHDHPG